MELPLGTVSKNVSKGVAEVLALVVTVLACVTRKLWHFLPENDAYCKATDSDLRLHYTLRIPPVHRRYSLTTLLTRDYQRKPSANPLAL